MTVICGVLGTILGLGIDQSFIAWIDLFASIAPPIAGPLLVDYYLIDKKKYHSALYNITKWNPAAFLAYAIGASNSFFAPDWIAKALVGLVVSMFAYVVLHYLFSAFSSPQKEKNASS